MIFCTQPEGKGKKNIVVISIFDFGISTNIMKTPSPKCYMTFSDMVIYSDILKWSDINLFPYYRTGPYDRFWSDFKFLEVRNSIEHYNGCSQPAVDAYSSGPRSCPILGLAFVPMLIPFFLNLSCFRTLNLEHPSVILVVLYLSSECPLPGSGLLVTLAKSDATGIVSRGYLWFTICRTTLLPGTPPHKCRPTYCESLVSSRDKSIRLSWAHDEKGKFFKIWPKYCQALYVLHLRMN